MESDPFTDDTYEQHLKLTNFGSTNMMLKDIIDDLKRFKKSACNSSFIDNSGIINYNECSSDDQESDCDKENRNDH